MSRTESAHINFLFFFFTACLWHLPLSYAANSISSARNLSDGEILVSANQLFEFGFFRFAESKNRHVAIRYHGDVAGNAVVWVANREKPLADSSSGAVGIANDGNLVIWGADDGVMWSSSASPSSTSSIAVLQDNGNLVLRQGNSTSSGRVFWESFDNPSDTMLPGMKIGIDLRTGERRTLRSWTSEDEPAPGIYEFGIDPQDSSQFFIWRGSVPYWRVLFWNGSRYNAILSLGSIEEQLNYSVVRTQDDVYFTFSFFPTTYTINTWLVMTTEGTLQIRSANRSGSSSVGYWSGRDSSRRCSRDGACGPNTSCNENVEPMCKCLPGFEPVSNSSLYSAGWRGGGCRAEEKLQCGAEDGFLELKGVQLADGVQLPAVLILYSRNETGCRETCTSCGCGCRAYSFAVEKKFGSPVCRIWPQDLKDLQEDGDDGSTALNLHVRVAASVLNLAGRQCEICGTSIIPYPLSTGPNCGDKAYRSLYCNHSTGRLYFQPQDGSSYEITSINPQTRRFKIKLEGTDLCWTGSNKRSDIQLNSSSPFQATRNNTILLLNCSSAAENSLPLNCRSSSPCHSYIREGRAPCFNPESCCSYIIGDSRSSTSQRIGVSNSRCIAYTSIISLNSSMDIKYWQEGVEIQWDAPQKPVCASSKDCDAWPNTSCQLDDRENGIKRCICNDNFQWDDSFMNCAQSKQLLLSN